VDLQNSDVEKSIKVADKAADLVESEDKEWLGDWIIGAFRNVFFEIILSWLQIFHLKAE
jgi:DNA-binding protein YbaB